MAISSVTTNNISKQICDKPDTNSKDIVKVGLGWFAVDMAVGTATDVFYNSKSKTKLSSKTLWKQAGNNALWAGVSACLFALPLSKLFEHAKGKNDTAANKNYELSDAMLAILMGFRLYVATRRHPKWKNAKFGEFF